MKSYFLKTLCVYFFLSITCRSNAQITGSGVQALNSTLSAARIKEAGYKLRIYNNGKDSISGAMILRRKISKEIWNSRPSIKIVEEGKSYTSKTKTIMYIDVKTLQPLLFESDSGDSLQLQAIIRNNKVEIISSENEAPKKSDIALSENYFFSNSFPNLW